MLRDNSQPLNLPHAKLQICLTDGTKRKSVVWMGGLVDESRLVELVEENNDFVTGSRKFVPVMFLPGGT